MADIEVLTDVEDDVITALVIMLGNGATIRDEARVAEQVTHDQDQAQQTWTPKKFPTTKNRLHWMRNLDQSMRVHYLKWS